MIFDFNGTLSDGRADPVPHLQRALGEHLNWDLTQQDYDRHLLGHSDREIVEKALEITGADGHDDDALLDLRKHRYRDLVADDNPIRPGHVRLVQLLADHEVPMAIVTERSATTSQACLSTSPVGELIRVVVAEEDVARGKPDPEVSSPVPPTSAVHQIKSSFSKTRYRECAVRSPPGWAASRSLSSPVTISPWWRRPWFRDCPSTSSSTCCRSLRR